MASQVRSQTHLQAAHMMLQAASCSSASDNNLPLLCALVTERAAFHFLLGGRDRKFAFHQLLAAHKYKVRF